MSLTALALGFLLLSATIQMTSLWLAARIMQIDSASVGRAVSIVLIWMVAWVGCLALQWNIRHPAVDVVVPFVSLGASVWLIRRLFHIRLRTALLTTFLSCALSLCMAVATALGVRLLLIKPYRFPSTSMQPTLLPEDQILVNTLVYRFRSPRRWDVAVFRSPSDSRKIFLKRVIGLPGESIEIRDGDVWINDTYLIAPRPLQHLRWESAGQFALPEQAFQLSKGCYFVVGDQPSTSDDSRYWGCIPRGAFIGKARWIFWPLNRVGDIQ